MVRGFPLVALDQYQAQESPFWIFQKSKLSIVISRVVCVLWHATLGYFARETAAHMSHSTSRDEAGEAEWRLPIERRHSPLQKVTPPCKGINIASARRGAPAILEALTWRKYFFLHGVFLQVQRAARIEARTLSCVRYRRHLAVI